MRRFPALCALVAVALLGVLASIVSRAAEPASALAPAKPTTPASPATPAPAAPAGVVRVAAVGVVNDHDFWLRLAERFTRATGVRVETVATGNKDGLPTLFKRGGVDLVTVPSADAVMALVADGWARDPQPWLTTDLMLVGPEADPAGVKGSPDLVTAVRRIAAAAAPIVVHDSGGASNVIRDVTQANGIELPAATTSFLLDDHQRRVFAVASERKAYTLIARIPFRSGKLVKSGLTAMLEGDPKLRRPYVLAVADPAKVPGAHVAEARRLAEFLRSPETQAWAADYGKGLAGDGPLFFPVTGAGAAIEAPEATASQIPATTRPAGSLLSVDGRSGSGKVLEINAKMWAALPRAEVRVTSRDGKATTYAGVPLHAVLLAAGAAPVGGRAHGDGADLSVIAVAADRYRATFSLAELDPASTPADHAPIVADRRDGQPLAANEGPLRLVVPADARPARNVKQVASIRVVRQD